MACPPHHVPYACAEQARNAATIHQIAHPHCEGFAPFPCGDHFHVGHLTAGKAQRCRQHPEHKATRRRIRAVTANL